MTKEELKAKVAAAQNALNTAQAELDALDMLAENHVFEDMETAESKIEDLLNSRAHADCEGSHNCGNDEYRQDFIVEGKMYTGIATYEYNRHDKTYYYVDGSTFRVEGAQPPAA